MKITSILAIAMVFSFSINSQTREELDSLNEYSKSIVCVDNVQFDSLSKAIIASATGQHFYSQIGSALINKAFQKRCLGDNEGALKILSKGLGLFSKAKDDRGTAKAYHQIAGCLMSLSLIDSASYYTQRMHKLALFLNDSVLLATAYLTKSTLSTLISQNDSIIYYAIQGLEVLGEISNDKIKGSLNFSLGNAFYQNEDFEQAINYYGQAQVYFPAQSVNLVSIQNNLATAFTKLSMYDSAAFYFEKAIATNQELGRKYYLAYNYQGLAENYNQAGDCKKAIEYNLLSKKLSQEMGEKRSLAGVYANLTECYLQLGEVENAIQSALMAIDLTKENGDNDKLADAYFLLSNAYQAKGDFKSAYEAHKNFYSLDSMLLNRDKQGTIAQLQTEYETEKKEAEIVSLSQQASIQALEIKQKNQVIIIGLVVIIFALIAIYFAYKQREIKKQQAQTELEQRFLRSQLNPHFISNALVAVQSFMLKNDSESAALYLTKFSKLMREILENSRKEFIPVEEEVSMLKNYLDIHKLRLGTFDYSVELDDNIDPEMDTIPPMFVQPFIENAIEHGIANLKEGKIELRFKKESDYISIEVNDNGVGLSPNTNVDHHSLSSTIIQERMELFNKSLKKKIQLVIANLTNESGEVNGTKVELKVPFSYI